MCLNQVMTYTCEAQADQMLCGPHFRVEPPHSGRLCMGHLMAVIERWLFNRGSNVGHYITSDLK